MADKSFGVKELNLLNASGTPTVTSPNNLNLNANTVAISTSATVGNNLTVSGQINVGSNIKIGNAGVVTATSFVGSGANLTGISAGISTDPSNVQATWKLGGGSGSGFTFTGPGQDGSEGNPDIYLVRGQRYLFDNTTLAGNHPFEFRNAANDADYTDGVSGAQNGLQYINVQHDAPAALKYRCTIHQNSMLGNIYIIGSLLSTVDKISEGNTEAEVVDTGSDGHFKVTTEGSERLRINAAGNVGIGTNDPTASNITTALSTNTKSLAVGIVTCNSLFVSGIKVTSGGHYADIAAATADGMNHYFPGSSFTSLISNLSPDNASMGTPTANNTADSYFNNYPYYDFYLGNNSESGHRWTQTTAKWGNGPFTIAFWVKPMASTLESESTFVQLGDHFGLRSMYTVSTDASRQIKTITIGDDSSANNQAVLSTDWNHWVTTYDSGVTRYYLNGSLAKSHTHSGTLDVGTANKYFWIGFGFWNSSLSNKASMSHMSDIGIWNAKALSAATISSIYNAKRTIVGY